MANPEEGEADLVVGDRTLVLRFPVRSINEAEKVLGTVWYDLAPSLADPIRVPLDVWATLLWAGCRSRQPAFTLDDAWEVMEKLRRTAKVQEALLEALQLAFPQTEGPATENPPPASSKAGAGS